jgi:hypothetical protein
MSITIKFCRAIFLLTLLYFISPLTPIFAQQNDSLLKDSITNITTQKTSKPTEVKTDKKIGKLPIKQSQLPQLGLTILLLAIFGGINYFYRGYVDDLFKNLITFTADTRILKNEQQGKLLPGVYFELLFLLLSLWFIYFYKKIIVNGNLSFTEIISCFAVIFGFLLFKLNLIKLVGWVFNHATLCKSIIIYNTNLRHVLSFLLAIALALCLLMKQSMVEFPGIYLPIILSCALYIYHLLKMLVFARNYGQIKFFDIFIYLCMVEILPWLITVLALYRLVK